MGNGSVYLLHSLLDGAKGIETIEDMASRYLAGVQAAAPDGPIRVAGYCHGGLAALELVRRLEAAGRTVEKVVLIDTFSLNARPPMRPIVPVVSWLGRWLPGGLGRKLSRSGMPSVWVLASHLLRRDPTILRRVTKTARSGSMRAWDASLRTTYYRAMSKYLPPQHPGRDRLPSLRGICRPEGIRRGALEASGAARAVRPPARPAQYLRQHACRRARRTAEPGIRRARHALK